MYELEPIGAHAPRCQTLYVSDKHYAVLDQPTQSGVIPPPVLGGLTYIGDALHTVTVIKNWIPVATIEDRLHLVHGTVESWYQEDPVLDRSIQLTPSGWWELLIMRTEVMPQQEAWARERDQRRAQRRLERPA